MKRGKLTEGSFDGRKETAAASEGSVPRQKIEDWLLETEEHEEEVEQPEDDGVSVGEELVQAGDSRHQDVGTVDAGQERRQSDEVEHFEGDQPLVLVLEVDDQRGQGGEESDQRRLEHHPLADPDLPTLHGDLRQTGKDTAEGRSRHLDVLEPLAHLRDERVVAFEDLHQEADDDPQRHRKVSKIVSQG